jgi:hypothetical protein
MYGKTSACSMQHAARLIELHKKIMKILEEEGNE